MRWSLLLLAVLSLNVHCFAQSAIPTGPIPDGLGVNIHFTQGKPGELKMLADAGITWMRMDFFWADIEKHKGKYDFTRYDGLVKELDAVHVHPLFILDYNNSLYGKGSPNTDAMRQAFARWAAASVTHFANRGILWEMWNEPNGGFWQPKANVDEYAKLALATGNAIHTAEPRATYIGPATSGVDLRFLEACCKAGCLNDWAAVSVHPYRQSSPETAAGDYQRLRGLIAKYAPAGKVIPIISGEWGYSVAWRNYSDTRQAQYLAREWLTNEWQHIPVSIWYDWHDDGTNPKNGEHNFGIVYNAYHPGREQPYDPKPAYLAAKALTTELRGFRFKARIATPHPDDFVLLFTKDGAATLAVWTTARKPREIVIPCSAGKFAVVSLMGEPLPAINAGAAGLKVAATGDVQYIIPSNGDGGLGR